MPLPDAKYPLFIEAAFYLLMSPLHILQPSKLMEGFTYRKVDEALINHVVGVQGISMLFIGLILLDAAYCGSAAGQKVVLRIALLAQIAGLAHEYNTAINVDATPIWITFGILLSCTILGLMSASQAGSAKPTRSKRK